MVEYQKKLNNMKELKKIATELETNYFNSRKKEIRFIPALCSGPGDNVKEYTDMVCNTLQEAENAAKDLIDEGNSAQNNVPAWGYTIMRAIITPGNVKLTQCTGYTYSKY